jgi:Fe-S-cluster containining protein
MAERNEDGLRVIQEVWGCARHAQMGPTCCETSEVLVTEGDKQRIAEHTGRDDFFEDRKPADPVYLQQDDDPNWLRWAFHPDGSRPVLVRRAGGACTFLGERGCTLPLEVRPLVCRLYPYTYTERGIDGVSDGCPREVVPPGRTLLEVLDMDRGAAERWHRMLYAELRTRQRCRDAEDEAPPCGSR